MINKKRIYKIIEMLKHLFQFCFNLNIENYLIKIKLLNIKYS